MTLCIPDIEVPHKATTIGPRTVVFGIRIGGTTENVLPAAEPPDPICIFNRVPGFMPQDAHTPLARSSFDFKHLGQLEFHETRMREIERDRNPRHSVRCEPFVRDPEMGAESKSLGLKFVMELLDMSGQEGAFDRNVETAHRQVQQFLIWPRNPNRLQLATGFRRWRFLKIRSRHNGF